MAIVEEWLQNDRRTPVEKIIALSIQCIFAGRWKDGLFA